MKIGKTLISFRRLAGPTLHTEILDVITHPESEIRQVIAKMARSEAKTYLDGHAQSHLDAFDARAKEVLNVAADAAPAVVVTDPALIPIIAVVEEADKIVSHIPTGEQSAVEPPAAGVAQS